MKNTTKKFALAGMSAILAMGSLAGCSGVSLEKYPETVAATYGNSNIYMDEANFFLRYQQWQQEAYYWDYITGYFGLEDLWVYPVDTNKTMEDSLKESIMAQLYQERILLDHAAEYNVELTDADKAKVQDTISNLKEELAPEFFQYVNMDDAKVTVWLENNALANKVWDAVKQEVTPEIADEDCEMFSLEYVYITEPTADDAAETEEADAEDAAAEEAEETLEGEELANAVLERLNAGESFESACADFNITSSSGDYLRNSADDTSELFLYGVQMKTGENGMFNSTNGGYYVVQCSSDFNKEATENQRAEMVDEQREEHFNEVYAGWAAAAPELTVNSCYEKLKVAIGEKIYVQPTTAETEAAETEATTEATETEATTEAAETEAAETEAATEAAETEAATEAAETEEEETSAAG